MLEFMILATSNVNTKLYDSTNTSGKTENEEAINEAWMSKVKQVYEKARLVYSNEEDFCQIQNLFKNCNSEVKKTKKT